MTRRTAQRQPYFTDWRDHTSTARREHVHGRLLPMERPEGELSLLSGLGLLLLIAVVAWLAVVAFLP